MFHDKIIFLLIIFSITATFGNPEVTDDVKADTKKQEKRGLLLSLGYGYDTPHNYGYGPRFDQEYGFHHDNHGINHINTVTTITKEVPVLHPYPVHVEKHVPYPVKVPYAVPVDRPYPVHVPKPYPITVEKPVPYPVKIKVPVTQPVAVPVPKPYPVHVEKPVPYPVSHPVYIEKQVPIYVKDHQQINHHDDYFGLEHGLSTYSGHNYLSSHHSY